MAIDEKNPSRRERRRLEVRARVLDAAWELFESQGYDATTVEQVMESGPTTVRADGLLQDLVDRMASRLTKLVVVTTPQGFLIGVMVNKFRCRGRGYG